MQRIDCRIGNADYGPLVLPSLCSASMHLDRAGARLVIYISSHCENCSEARRLADLAAMRYPTLPVRVVDLDMERPPPPDYIVAVPTYVMDGRVIALGNPDSEELMANLRQALA
jgi:hypothetical protein